MNRLSREPDDAGDPVTVLREATLHAPRPVSATLAARLRRRLGANGYADVVRAAGLGLQLELPYTPTGAELIGQEEERNLQEVLRRRRLWRYEIPHDESFVGRFEARAEELLGVRHVHATVSGTEALRIAMLALGVGPGDEVLIPCVTWVGCADAVILCGAVPVPCRVDDTLGLDADAVTRRIGPRSKAIMAVSLYGNPCDLVALRRVADDHGLALLEDDCQAAGVSLHGRRLGTFGDAAVFSTNFMKFVAAGEGGFVATDRDDIYAFAVAYTGGKTFPARKRGMQAPEIPHSTLRMNELTGAVALAQLDRLDVLLGRLRVARDTLLDALGGPALSYRRLVSHDPRGDAGWCTPLLFADERTCQAFAMAARGRGVRHVTTAHERFAGGEIDHCYAVMARERLIGAGGAHWADEFGAMRARRSIDARANPWSDPHYGGDVTYPDGFMDAGLRLVRRLALIQTNPRLEGHHCRAIAEQLREADYEVAAAETGTGATL